MSRALQFELRLAERMSRLGTETAFEVLNRARALERQGKDIIHLEIGEPDFDTPQNVIEAGVEAMRGGWTHYGPSAGYPDLRQAIADEVSRSRGVRVASEEVVVVPGGKPIIFFSLIILNSPQNPTGGVLSKRDIEQIAEAVGDRNIFILSDEIYSRLIFEGKHHSIIAEPGFKERTILLDGFSKSYAMTGWRMGYGVMRADLAVQVARLMTNSNSCTASFTQVAGIEALRGDQGSVDLMRLEFQRRRDMFVAGLNRIKGFSCRMPHGAFYVFPNVTAIGWKSKPLADALLEEAGVACFSGTSFGEFGEGYLRFSIANSMENLSRALERIAKWMSKKGV